MLRNAVACAMSRFEILQCATFKTVSCIIACFFRLYRGVARHVRAVFTCCSIPVSEASSGPEVAVGPNDFIWIV